MHNVSNLQVVEADMNDVNSLKYALKGADACFLVTVTYFRTGEFNSEVQQVSHIIRKKLYKQSDCSDKVHAFQRDNKI